MLSPAARADSRGFLYRATLNGHTMYLYGTTHLANARNAELDGMVRQAMTQASSLSLETHPDDNGGLLGLLWQSVQLSGAPALKLISEADRTILDKLLRQYGISTFVAQHMNTYMLTAMLTLKELEAMGYSGQFNHDTQLLKLAKARGLPVRGLERTQAQSAIFSTIPPDKQAEALSAILHGIEDGSVRKEFGALMALWERGDAAGMTAHLANESQQPGADLVEQLLPERNKQMAEKCYSLLVDSDRALVSVGAAHLLGKDNVLDLLTARGATVERVAAHAQARTERAP